MSFAPRRQVTLVVPSLPKLEPPRNHPPDVAHVGAPSHLPPVANKVGLLVCQAAKPPPLRLSLPEIAAAGKTAPEHKELCLADWQQVSAVGYGAGALDVNVARNAVSDARVDEALHHGVNGIYGEVRPAGVEKWLRDHVDVKRTECLLELGSGAGKFSLQVFCQTTIASVIAVEFFHERHLQALAAATRVAASSSAFAKVGKTRDGFTFEAAGGRVLQYRCQNALDVPEADLARANVIFCDVKFPRVGCPPSFVWPNLTVILRRPSSARWCACLVTRSRAAASLRLTAWKTSVPMARRGSCCRPPWPAKRSGPPSKPTGAAAAMPFRSTRANDIGWAKQYCIRSTHSCRMGVIVQPRRHPAVRIVEADQGPCFVAGHGAAAKGHAG